MANITPCKSQQENVSAKGDTMLTCIDTMNPRDSGVLTSAWYMGIAVTSAPMPSPLMIRPAVNMPLLVEPAHRAAPMMRIPAAYWIVLLREYLSAK